MTEASEGLIGGPLPVARFVFPIVNGTRFVELIAAGVPDMRGSREQSVWFRYTVLECAGKNMAPPCSVQGKPAYFDTYWWSGEQAGTRGPQHAASASGFYANLLEVRRWWRVELAKEGSLHARRQAMGYIYDKQLVHALFEAAPDRYSDRDGGYTRVLRDGYRKGDNSEMGVIELL